MITNSFKEFYLDELTDYQIYLYLSDKAKNKTLKENLKLLGETELKHANFWKELIKEQGETLPIQTKNKLLIYKIISSFLSIETIVYLRESGEKGDIKKYYDFLQNKELSEKQKTGLKNIIIDEIEHENALKNTEIKLDNLRDFILGMNDGLVELLGTVAGLTAVYTASPHLVGLSGLIVGCAGALSMGIGAFISVRGQRQINEANNDINNILNEIYPEKVIDSFTSKLVDSGVPNHISKDIGDKLLENKSSLKGLFEEETTENEYKSGLFTGSAYIVGVVFPVAPYFIFSSSITALITSIILASIMLGTVGIFIAISSGISLRQKIAEMVVSGFFAVLLSYVFGSIIQKYFEI